MVEDLKFLCKGEREFQVIELRFFLREVRGKGGVLQVVQGLVVVFVRWKRRQLPLEG